MGRWRDLRFEYSKYSDGAKRMAVNTIIQSGAGELIKMAMVNIFNDEECNDYNTKIRMNIHDELVLTCDYKYAEKCRSRAKYLMENVVDLGIPLLVDAKLVDTWGDMKD